jgi:Fe-S-cluster-containing dehydrogenase component
MKKIMVVNVDNCVGCRNCSFACSLVRDGSFSLARACVAPVWLVESEINVPSICNHCNKPPCKYVCPVEAITRDEETGIVKHNPAVCIGCKQCLMACPFGGVFMEPSSGEILKCDLCGGDPECVKHCLYGALEWIDASDLALTKRKSGAKRIIDALEQLL